MKPPLSKSTDASTVNIHQTEIVKSMVEATAQITAAMVTVSNEKNPAKISEAYRVIYKTIQEVVRGAAPKPTSTQTTGSG